MTSNGSPNARRPATSTLNGDAPRSPVSARGDRHPSSPTSGASDGERRAGVTFTHRFHHDKSILSLTVSGSHVYAGTQGGEILVFLLNTFELVRCIEAHNGAVLGFCLSKDGSLLFSSAGDRYVNAWNVKTLEHEASIYSTYDVGDVFCVSYSTSLRTLYLGCQNTSLQWQSYRGDESARLPNLRSHPSFREDRFFDSLGPGGTRTPRSDATLHRILDHRQNRDLEIDRNNIHQFAHYGYIFAMQLADGQIFGVQDGEALITGGGDGVVKLWAVTKKSFARPEEICVLQDGKDDGNSVLSMTLDGSFLYTGRARGQVNVWDMETRQLLRTLRPHKDEVLALSVIRSSLFSASTDGNIASFTQRQEPLENWRAHSGRVLASAQTMLHGRPVYLTGGNDNTVTVWDVADAVQTVSKSAASQDNQMFEALRVLVSHRTVSSDAKYKADCRRGASYLRSVFKNFGAETALLRTEQDFNPVVYARFRGTHALKAAKRTILFYGHYDVIPAEDRQKKWRTDPFTLTGADGYLYGRGASDNKGPSIAAMFAAADLWASQQLQCDVVFLIEGEEECGSRGFQNAVKQNRELIGPVDWIILANSYWLDDELPCLTYGLRGVLHACVEVESDEPDLHSGVDGSVLLDEPLKDLTVLAATLTGPQRKVQIPGFYDYIPDMTDDERRLYEDITRYLLSTNPGLGSPGALTESIIKRTREPSLTFHGFRTSGSEKSTIIPHLASAAMSIRLVPNQEVDKIAAALVDHLQQNFRALGSKNHLRVRIDHRAEPWVADFRNDIFKTLEKAVTEVWAEAKDPRRRYSSSASSSGTTAITPPANVFPKSLPHSTSSPLAPTSSTIAAATSPLTGPTRSHSIEELSLSNLGDPVVPTTATISAASSTMSQSLPSGPAAAVSTHATTDAQRHQKGDVARNNGAAEGGDTASATASRHRKPLYVREGGSIPAVRFLEKELNAAAAHLPCGQASDNAHLDNERFRVINLLNSREIFRRVFTELPRT